MCMRAVLHHANKRCTQRLYGGYQFKASCSGQHEPYAPDTSKHMGMFNEPIYARTLHQVGCRPQRLLGCVAGLCTQLTTGSNGSSVHEHSTCRGENHQTGEDEQAEGTRATERATLGWTLHFQADVLGCDREGNTWSDASLSGRCFKIRGGQIPMRHATQEQCRYTGADASCSIASNAVVRGKVWEERASGMEIFRFGHSKGPLKGHVWAALSPLSRPTSTGRLREGSAASISACVKSCSGASRLSSLSRGTQDSRRMLRVRDAASRNLNSTLPDPFRTLGACRTLGTCTVFEAHLWHACDCSEIIACADRQQPHADCVTWYACAQQCCHHLLQGPITTCCHNGVHLQSHHSIWWGGGG